jgi:nitroreductase
MNIESPSIPDIKLPDTSAELITPIRDRWSPRAFLDRPVPVETLRTLLEAARWASSCFNEQPWRYIVARREETEEFARLLSVLMEKNQAWAKFAPVLLLSVGKKTFAHNGKPNRHHLHDTGAATATLSIQAAAMGLQAHSMAGYDLEKARVLFGIPEDFEPAAAIAVGYPGPVSAAPPAFQAAEAAKRTRKPLSEFAFTTTWGTPASL